MKISVDIAERFSVPADPKTTFDLLADVPRSVGHFPDIHDLVDLGGGAYRWELKPLSAAGIGHQVIYASRYIADARNNTVTWTAVKGIGNGLIEGRWQLREQEQGSAIAFETRGELEVPILFRGAARPVVQGLFYKQVKSYLHNIRRSLSV